MERKHFIEQHLISPDALSLQEMQKAQHTLISYTGREGAELYLYGDAMRNGTDLPSFLSPTTLDDLDYLQLQVDTNVFRTISEEYNVDFSQAKDLYEMSMSGSNKMMQDIVRTALSEDHLKTFALRNEILTYPNSPADRLWRLAYDYRDQGERFQMLGQLLTTETFLNFYGRYPKREVKTELYEFEKFLNTYVFGSGEESTELFECTTWHHDETNEYGGLAEKGVYMEGYHPKKHQFITRTLQNGGSEIRINTNPRTKSYITAAEKAWGKALKFGRNVSPTLDVNDLAGLRITAMGGQSERDYVYSMLVDKLVKYGGGYLDGPPIEDHKVDGRTNCDGIDWRRLKVKLYDVPFQIEVIVEDLPVYLNGEHYIGTDKNPRKPTAHKEFERDRAETLFRHFFRPNHYKAVYNRNDIEGAIEKRKHQVKNELLSQNRISEEDILENGKRITPLN
jgi:hypothetical protein